MGQQQPVSAREDTGLTTPRGGGPSSFQQNRQTLNKQTSHEDHYDEPYEPYRRAAGYSKDHPGLIDFSTEDKSQELCGILKALEVQLENPTDFGVIGRTYRRLAEWTWEHQQDSDFPQVLELLAPEHMYPAWRRQALEEAYMLFFEDCAKQGNPKALEQLPEPPTSKEIGYRPLPEGLLDPKTTRGAAFTNTYEAGNPCCIRRRWDYEVVRNGPRPRPGERKAAGRKIVAKDNQQRYCACAVDPMTRLMQVMMPDGFCGGRANKVPIDNSGMPEDLSDVPAPGSRPRSAALPSSTEHYKSKRAGDQGGTHYSGNGFPVPPHSPHENPGRANHSLFSKDDGRPSPSVTV